MVLRSVAGEAVGGKSYQGVVAMIRGGARPLTMTFLPQHKTVQAVFTEAGSLGLSFVCVDAESPPRIRSLIEGTQASGMGQLEAGMMLVEIGGQPVKRQSYKECIALLKAAGRPLLLSFEDVGPLPERCLLSPSSSPRASRQQQQEEEEIAVTFTEEGALGLKFLPDKATRTVQLLALNSGTQAEKHAATLHSGMVLRSVAGEAVAGKSYQGVLAMIKAGGRPLAMTFLPGGAGRG
jgi:hypothetical protein